MVIFVCKRCRIEVYFASGMKIPASERCAHCTYVRKIRNPVARAAIEDFMRTTSNWNPDFFADPDDPQPADPDPGPRPPPASPPRGA